MKTLLNDKGVNGKCIPLTHFGGFNTFEALKEVIPQLKKEGKVFRLLDDNLDYAVKDLKLISIFRILSTYEVSYKNFNFKPD